MGMTGISSWLKVLGIFGIMALLVGGAVIGHAQPARIGGGFEAGSPEVGELIPEVSVYSEQGIGLNLREHLAGSYTVLVFGCLT